MKEYGNGSIPSRLPNIYKNKELPAMNIQGFTKTTLLDYPGKIAAVIFLGGCNFRCPFCHNSSLVLSPAQPSGYSLEDILPILEKRRNLLDGVCISGGEPTLDPDLTALCKSIKSLGFSIKLDTNGTNPALLKELADNRLIDYVAMDIKTSLQNYPLLTGVSHPDINKIRQSAQWLLAGSIPFEFRTTVVRELHSDEDFIEIGRWLAGAPQYYLQVYQDSAQVIHPGFTPCSKSEMEHFLELLRPAVPSALLRGID